MFQGTFKKILKSITRRRSIVRVYRRKSGLAGTTHSYETHKEAARAMVHQKLAQWNAHYQHTYGRVAIRNQKSRWGSCSTKGNLNFHYRLLTLPESLQDYVIVHELCHLREFNHGEQFWALVAQTIPDHAFRRRALKTHAVEKNGRTSYTHPYDRTCI